MDVRLTYSIRLVPGLTLVDSNARLVAYARHSESLRGPAFVHFFPEAEWPHISPDLFDIREAFRF